MIDKIIHFSDLHIKYNKDHDLYKQILEGVLKDWKEEKPDRIVFTGDLIHQKNQISPEQVDFVAWFLNECSNIAKTVMILGNHDFLETNSDRLDPLSVILELMDNKNIVLYKNRGIYEDENVNWCVFSLMENNLHPGKPEGLFNIGLFHGRIYGLSTDLGFQFEDGYDPSKFFHMDIVLAGDIHKRQVFNIPDGKRGYMVGSLIQQDKGERISKHGYGIYTIKSDEYRFVDVHNPRPHIKFKINSIDDIEMESEQLMNY